VNEGDPISLSLSAASDPSSADTTRRVHARVRLRHRIRIGNVRNRELRKLCDERQRHPHGRRKRPRQGRGATSYTASVTIDNVAPTANFGAPGTVDEGDSIALIADERIGSVERRHRGRLHVLVRLR
jgi:hypothetical protein